MPGAVADDAGGQAEIAAVGDSERFLIILDADRRDDGAEHFLIVDPHVGRGVGDDGGLHVIAGGRSRRAVTADILLADRALKAGAMVLGPNGKPFTPASIGPATATRVDQTSEKGRVGEGCGRTGEIRW